MPDLIFRIAIHSPGPVDPFQKIALADRFIDAVEATFPGVSATITTEPPTLKA